MVGRDRSEQHKHYVATMVSEAVLDSLIGSRLTTGGSEESENLTTSVDVLRQKVLTDEDGVLSAFLEQDAVKLLAYSYRSDLASGEDLVGTNDIQTVSMHSKNILVVLGKLAKDILSKEDGEDISSKVSTVTSPPLRGSST